MCTCIPVIGGRGPLVISCNFNGRFHMYVSMQISYVCAIAICVLKAPPLQCLQYKAYGVDMTVLIIYIQQYNSVCENPVYIQ